MSARERALTRLLMIAPVPRKRLKTGRRCGWSFGGLSKSAAVPATVSGERDAHRFPPLRAAATGPDAKSCEAWEGVHQALTRKPGDLPASWSLLPGSRGWSRHGELRLSDEPLRLGPQGQCRADELRPSARLGPTVRSPARLLVGHRPAGCPACRQLLGAGGISLKQTEERAVGERLRATIGRGGGRVLPRRTAFDRAPIEIAEGEDA
ncbi:hypothetical protein GGR43_000905 [Sphingobium jiangsuense]|uniref:Uncharacterized protein n=1 Tax=Sphingobium jiangsuense TaxID=870476 RepID=A0A7W6BFQ6_9SPHN|nr:hypothetical protein [Sphingobium jiangsuense]